MLTADEFRSQLTTCGVKWEIMQAECEDMIRRAAMGCVMKREPTNLYILDWTVHHTDEDTTIKFYLDHGHVEDVHAVWEQHIMPTVQAAGYKTGHTILYGSIKQYFIQA